MGNQFLSQSEPKANQGDELSNVNIHQDLSNQSSSLPNVSIKQSKINNVSIVKQQFQIVSADLIFESIDKVQVDLLLSSIINFDMICYTFVQETRSLRFGNQQKFEKCMHQSSMQKFECPPSLCLQVPPKHLEFMVVDVISFGKNKQTNQKQYFHLIIELKHAGNSQYQWLYFYKIEMNEETYECKLRLIKECIVCEGQQYEVGELFGVNNTVFNPEWNPNTIEDKECVICFSKMINTVLLPCKHMCICNDCADHIINLQANKLCPLCRLDITNYITIEIKDEEKKAQQNKDHLDQKQQILNTMSQKPIFDLKQSIVQKKLQEIQVEKQKAIKIQQEFEEEKKRQQEIVRVQKLKYLDDNFGSELKIDQILDNFSAESDSQSGEEQNQQQFYSQQSPQPSDSNLKNGIRDHSHSMDDFKRTAKDKQQLEINEIGGEEELMMMFNEDSKKQQSEIQVEGSDRNHSEQSINNQIQHELFCLQQQQAEMFNGIHIESRYQINDFQLEIYPVQSDQQQFNSAPNLMYLQQEQSQPQKYHQQPQQIQQIQQQEIQAQQQLQQQQEDQFGIEIKPKDPIIDAEIIVFDDI